MKLVAASQPRLRKAMAAQCGGCRCRVRPTPTPGASPGAPRGSQCRLAGHSGFQISRRASDKEMLLFGYNLVTQRPGGSGLAHLRAKRRIRLRNRWTREPEFCNIPGCSTAPPTSRSTPPSGRMCVPISHLPRPPANGHAPCNAAASLRGGPSEMRKKMLETRSLRAVSDTGVPNRTGGSRT